ncbi:hypothetical protein RCL1_000476 [Eukaryota sp. TZLM3-RCL]
MSKRLYLNNLPFGFTKLQLQQKLQSQEVSIEVLRTSAPEKNHYAIIEAPEDVANWFLHDLKDQNFGCGPIEISEARPRRPPQCRSKSRPPHQRNAPQERIELDTPIFAHTQRQSRSVSRGRMPNNFNKQNDFIINSTTSLPIIPGYTSIKRIATGAQGDTILVEDGNRNKFCAKIVKNLSLDSSPEAKVLLKQLNSPFLVPLYDCFPRNKDVVLIMEYLAGGSLHDFIEKQQPTSTDIWVVITQLVHGLHYLHQNGIVHRDLKPNNVMLCSTQRPIGVKICDFGISRDLSTGAANTWIGTILFMAPEVLQNQPYGFAVDLWSLGVLVYKLVHGVLPFNNFHEILCSKIPFSNSEFGPIISKLLVRDPASRATAAELLLDPMIIETYQRFIKPTNIEDVANLKKQIRDLNLLVENQSNLIRDLKSSLTRQNNSESKISTLKIELNTLKSTVSSQNSKISSQNSIIQQQSLMIKNLESQVLSLKNNTFTVDNSVNDSKFPPLRPSSSTQHRIPHTSYSPQRHSPENQSNLIAKSFELSKQSERHGLLGRRIEEHYRRLVPQNCLKFLASNKGSKITLSQNDLVATKTSDGWNNSFVAIQHPVNGKVVLSLLNFANTFNTFIGFFDPFYLTADCCCSNAFSLYVWNGGTQYFHNWSSKSGPSKGGISKGQEIVIEFNNSRATFSVPSLGYSHTITWPSGYVFGLAIYYQNTLWKVVRS